MTLQQALKVSGKAYRKEFRDWIYYLKDGEIYSSICGRHSKSSISFNECMEDVWHPLEEPCKHEPLESRNSMSWLGANNEVKVQELGDPFYTPKCKHCGAKIKATGWVVCE